MATKRSTVQPKENTPAEDAAKVVQMASKRTRAKKEPAAPPPPLAEMTDAEFLAIETPGEQMIAIRVRGGEIAYRGFGGVTWALARAAVLDVNHMLEQETLQRLIAAEGRVAAIANAATG